MNTFKGSNEQIWGSQIYKTLEKDLINKYNGLMYTRSQKMTPKLIRDTRKKIRRNAQKSLRNWHLKAVSFMGPFEMSSKKVWTHQVLKKQITCSFWPQNLKVIEIKSSYEANQDGTQSPILWKYEKFSPFRQFIILKRIRYTH